MRVRILFFGVLKDLVGGSSEEADFPGGADLRAVFDGRNSLRALALPVGVAYVGVGVQASTRSAAGG